MARKNKIQLMYNSVHALVVQWTEQGTPKA